MSPEGSGWIRRMRPRVHYTWLLVIPLISAAVVTQFSVTYPLWQRAILGLIAAALFLVALTIRELILALFAARKGVRVERVTLFAFGGLTQIDKNTSTPALEVTLSLLGLLVNLVTAGVFTAVYLVLAGTGSALADILAQWLAFIWVMLAILHFVPGFPLDGGRALRALLWRLTGSYEKATRTASWTGWAIGLIAAAGGILLLVISKERFTGVFLIAVGLVLQNAATHGRRLAGQADAHTAEPQDN